MNPFHCTYNPHVWRTRSVHYHPRRNPDITSVCVNCNKTATGPPGAQHGTVWQHEGAPSHTVTPQMFRGTAGTVSTRQPSTRLAKGNP